MMNFTIMIRKCILILLTFCCCVETFSQENCFDDKSDYSKLLWKGYLTENSGKTFDAIEIYKKAILIDSVCIGGYNLLSTAYFKVGDYKNVIKSCNHILKLQPEDYGVLYRIGFSFQALENYDLAIKYYLKALRFDNSNLTILGNLSLAYSDNDMKDKAIETISIALRIIELNPTMENAVVAFTNKKAGILYFHNGDKDKALNLLLKADSKISKDGELSFLIGLCYDEKANFKNAKKYLKKAIKYGLKLDPLIKEKYQLK